MHLLKHVIHKQKHDYTCVNNNNTSTTTNVKQPNHRNVSNEINKKYLPLLKKLLEKEKILDKIELNDFIERTYMNLIPTSIKTNLTNYDEKISTVTFSYIHTPLINELIKHINQSTLSNINQFNKTFTYTVQ
ncbi:hypothetical protein ENUP19_0159G0018 [Entamoeba nuttalli]|uniref:Uncharacterized protein n=1 Tax=Entamoeba nuttalli TaxID=412467 RepID=A0ABQ0DD81_9EUKA